MATKQTRLTPFGRKVRKRLIDKNMTQVELEGIRKSIFVETKTSITLDYDDTEKED